MCSCHTGYKLVTGNNSLIDETEFEISSDTFDDVCVDVNECERVVSVSIFKVFA